MMGQQDRSGGSTWLRRLLVGFVVITCLRVWLGPVDILPQARGQIPDGGLQRKQMVDAVRETNRQMSQILTVLKSGTLNVRVVSTDKTGAAGGLAPTGRKR
ncbi:MAG TPA: hypothetical protein VM243_19950 [Phycisphaerae bacterium]|nr:hypothetical protein [Phycisphaerae bacterium]